MSGGQLHHQRGLEEWLEKTNKRLAALERSVRMPFSAVDSEGVTYRDGGAARFLAPDGDKLVELDQSGLVLFGADGSTKLIDLTTDGLKLYDTDGSTELVTLDTDGLSVNGGDVVAVSIDSDFQTFDSVPNSLNTSITTYITKTFTPPSWANVVQVIAFADMRVWEQDSASGQGAFLRIDIEGNQRNQTGLALPADEERQIGCMVMHDVTSFGGDGDVTVEARARKSISDSVILIRFQLNTIFIATVA